METLSFEFPAGQPPRGRTLVGCVGSGDLEVLIEPGQAGKLTITVQTSVNGSEQRWQHLFARMFDGRHHRRWTSTSTISAPPRAWCVCAWSRVSRRSAMTDSAELLHKHSFVELGARQRAKALLDAGTFRELLDPFQRVMSPWLSRQGVVPQADDGVMIAKGSIDGLPVVIGAIEGRSRAAASVKSAGRSLPARWSWRPKTTATASRPVPCCCWKPVAYACRRPTSAWRRLPMFMRRLSTCASTNR
jgi:malonate decarboxylase acyl carrier protein